MKVLDTPDLAGLEAAEGRLQAAVAGNNADGLALSLHDDLLATAPDGAFATKAEDVAGYASGAFRVTSYRQLRRRSLLRAGTGVTAVRAHIRGSAGGDEFEVVMTTPGPGCTRTAGGRSWPLTSALRPPPTRRSASSAPALATLARRTGQPQMLQRHRRLRWRPMTPKGRRT